MAGQFRRKKKERTDTRAVRIDADVMAIIELEATTEKTSLGAAASALIRDGVKYRGRVEDELMDLGRS